MSEISKLGDYGTTVVLIGAGIYAFKVLMPVITEMLKLLEELNTYIHLKNGDMAKEVAKNSEALKELCLSNEKLCQEINNLIKK